MGCELTSRYSIYAFESTVQLVSGALVLAPEWILSSSVKGIRGWRHGQLVPLQRGDKGRVSRNPGVQRNGCHLSTLRV